MSFELDPAFYRHLLSSYSDRYCDLITLYYEQSRHDVRTYAGQIPTSTFVIIILSICIPPLAALIFYEREAARTRAEEPKGCRKLGMKIDSNLSNEFDRKFAEGRPPSTEETSAEWWRIKSLWIYPIKSCQGVELNRATILQTGMEYDRQFTFAQLKPPPPTPAGVIPAAGEKREHRWEFITQRQYPALARVRTQMWAVDQSVTSYSAHADDVEGGGVIVVSFPYQAPGWRGLVAQAGAALKGEVPEMHFRIPFEPSLTQIERAGFKYEQMTIWKDTVSALNVEPLIPDEFRQFLGMSNKLGLFRIDNDALREVYRCAPTKEQLGWQPVTGFQDAYPLHIINLASVRDVERQMPTDKNAPRLSAKRFRANIVVTGPPAYDEDTWKKIKIGWYEYAVACRTARCKLPNVDQTTGIKHPSEPDHTLRTKRNVDVGAGEKVGCLGMQMVPIMRDSAIRVGDEITVLEMGEHVYINQ